MSNNSVRFGEVIGSRCTPSLCKSANTFLSNSAFNNCGSNTSVTRQPLNYCPFKNGNPRINAGTGCYCGQNCPLYGDCCHDFRHVCIFPEVHQLTPLNAPTSGGTLLTIRGLNFNHTSDSLTPSVYARGNIYVQFGSANITAQFINNNGGQVVSRTELRFTLPAGTGKSIPISVRYQAPQVNSYSVPGGSYFEAAVDKESNTVTFDYDAPTIAFQTDVSNGVSTTGQSVVLTGVSHGNNMSVLSVFVDGVNYGSSIVTQLSHTSTTVTIPPGVGNSKGIYIVVDEQSSNTLFFDYNRMVVSSFNPQTAPTNARVSGSQAILTINGSDFGPTGHVVSVGPNSCPVLTGTHNRITCTLPAGTGVNMIRVYNMENTIVMVSSFVYDPPTITSAAPLMMPTTGGVLTLIGQSFFTNAQINIGATLCQASSATGVLITGSAPTSNHTHTFCVVPAGDGIGYTIKLSSGSYTAFHTDTFGYNSAIVNSITPTVGPTLGNQVVTINGLNFGLYPQAFINGQLCTPSGIVSHTQIVCRTNVGQGVGFTVPIVSGASETINPAVLYNYSPPAITSLTPLTASTAGNVILTFAGSNFGVSGSITVGPYTCVPTGTAFNHTHVTCLLPTGSGVNHLAVITVSGQATSQNIRFSFSPPTISNVLPVGPPTAGGIAITLTGLSLGLSGGQVTIVTPSGDLPCPLRTQTHGAVTCTLPPGAGKVNVTFNIDGQSTFFNNYEYAGPSISVITPLNAATTGGTPITISGASFEGTKGTGTVTVGGQPCTPSTWTHVQIVCALPVGFGPTNTVLVRTTEGKTATFNYMYGTPTITGITGGPLPTDGTGIITITGTNYWLGQTFNIPAGTNLVDNKGSVTANGSPCSILTWGQTTITCRPVAGEGISKSVQVSILYVTPGTASVSNVRQFSYQNPTITNVTPISGPTLGGTRITVTGTNFGSTGSFSISISSGVCTDIQRIPATFYTTATCLTPAGQGDVGVQVSSGGVLTNSFPFTYDAPVISSFSPNTGPTEGGNVITILGTSFSSNPTVTVGGSSCIVIPNPSAPLSIHSTIVCTVPTGQGVKQVQVLAGPLSSNVLDYTYDNPTLISISPTNGMTNGGNIVNITGTNFGTNALAYIGSTPCIVVQRSHKWLTCSVPSNSGAGKEVYVAVEGTLALNTNILYSYNPPVVNTVLPQLEPTAGSSVITLTGTSLGSSGTVTIDGNECFDTGNGFTHDQITCILPSGDGLNKQVVVDIGDQIHDLRTYSYRGPNIVSIAPAFGPTSGNIPLTISGISFGIDSNNGVTHTVTVNGVSCPVGTGNWNHNQVVCNLPGGYGTVNVVMTTPAGTHTVPWTYSSPQILNISPQLISTRGSVPITITGASFDIYTDAGNSGIVLIGGTPCSVTSWDHTEIICVAAAGLGSHHDVTITTSHSVTFVGTNAISYYTPFLESFAVASIHAGGSNVAQTRGGNVLTIYGQYLSTPAFINSVSVAVSGRNCPVLAIDITSDAILDIITCTYPAGSGLGHQVIVNIGGVESNIMYMNYGAPVLIPTVPLSSTTQGGTIIEVEGYNIISAENDITKAIVITVGATTNVCTFVSSAFLAAPSIHEVVRCSVGPGVGSNRPVAGVFSGQSSNQLMLNYLRPSVFAVTPNLIGTAEQPLITITGESFSTSGTVNVGTAQCTQGAPGTSWTHSTIVCTAPKGEGVSNIVRVIVGTLSSVQLVYLPYHAPVITTISPVTGPTMGGTSITLTGTNFGLNPSVTVDYSNCALSGTVDADHTVVVCVSPTGTGLNKPVILTVGEQASNSVIYSYQGPVITNVSPQNGPTSGSNIITLTGTSFGSNAVVSVGGNPCLITFIATSGTEIRCRVPAGIGALIPLTVQANGQSSTCEAVAPNVCTYSYGLPTLTTTSITGVATAGGELITLVGTNFGSITGTVTVAGTTCTIEQWTHTNVECKAPSGIGRDNAVILTTSNGNSVSTTLTYASPILTSIQSDNGYPSLGSIANAPLLTITGRNFGTNPALLQVNVIDLLNSGNVIRPAFTSITSVTDTTIIGTLSSGSGTAVIRVDLTHNSFVFNSVNTLTFTYDSPIVTRVEGCDGNTATTTYDCPLAGGRIITVIGKNFYANGVLGTNFQVLVEFANTDAVCTSPQFAEPVDPAHNPDKLNMVTCLLPSFNSGSLVDLTVVVRLDIGNQGSLIKAVSYTGPSIVPNTLTLMAGTDDKNLIYEGVYTSTLTGISTDTNTRIGFMVKNLFSTTNVDMTITYGPAGNTNRYQCTDINVINVSASETPVVFCNIAGGVGTNNVFVLTEFITVVSASVTTVPGTDKFTFTPPIIQPLTLMLTYSNTDFTTIPNGNTGIVTGTSNDGQYIQFNVTNIGVNPAHLKIRYGLMTSPLIVEEEQPVIQAYNAPGSYPLECNAITIVSPGVLTCYTQAGNGGPYGFLVTAGDQDSNAGVDQYWYPDSPIVTDVAGCDATSDALVNYTQNCPTRGNVRITITGQRFGSALTVNMLSILVGIEQCTGIQWVNEYDDAGITYHVVSCMLPFGSGTQGVSVINGALWSSSYPLVRYHAPVIATITSANCVSGGSLLLNDCQRIGGYLLTITGTYFGPNDGASKIAYVLIGGQACTNVVHDPVNGHENIKCTLAQGMGKNKAVKLLQSGSNVASTNSGILNFVSCPAGTYNDGTNIACIKCTDGSYSAVPDASICNPCNPGEYSASLPAATIGQIACTSCTAGKYSGASASACIDCAVGRYAPSQGFASCTSCPPGTKNPNTGASVCDVCGAGKFQAVSEQTICDDCTAGKYQDMPGQGSCTPCQVGRFSSAPGSSLCTACSAGTFAASTNSIICSSCAEGTAQPSGGQASCIACDSGRYQSSPGRNVCTACAPGSYSVKVGTVGPISCTSCELGKYQASAGQATCLPCASGSYNDVTGREECKMCVAGTYNSIGEQSICSTCPFGTYSTLPGTITCTQCGLGSYRNAASPSSTTCSLCAEGAYQDEMGREDCKPCMAGTANNVPGQSSCSQCASGFFSDTPSSTSCAGCATGKYNIADAGDISSTTTCTNCTVGYYNAATGSSFCTVCEAGSVSTSGAVACELCNPGKYVLNNVCVDCPAGTFSSTSGALSCQQCGSGQYTDVPGKERCDDCPAGSFQNSLGQTLCNDCAIGSYSLLKSASCTACDAGTFSDVVRSPSCTECTLGKYQQSSGQSDCVDCADGTYTDGVKTITCKPCDSGRYTNSTSGREICATCNAGSFSLSQASSCTLCETGKYASTPSSAECTLCKVGQYAGTVGSTECISCLAGTYQQFEGGSTCQNCFNGDYVDFDGANQCLQCALGTFSNAVDEPKTTCEVCTGGTYSSSQGSSSCTQCTPGYYAEGARNSGCLPCIPGTFAANPGTERCDNCIAGSYQYSVGQSFCDDCEAGKANPFIGQTSCTDCTPGKFTNTTSRTECFLCESGTFSDKSGLSVCTDCTPGKYQESSGFTLCDNCGVGKYTNDTRKTVCTECSAGYQQDISGKTVCNACNPGGYSDTLGAALCAECSPGRFSGASAATVCAPCAAGTASSDTGVSVCGECAIGAYAPNENLLSCLECTTGTYSNVTGSSICTNCERGKSQGDTAQSTCIDCIAGSFASVEGSIECSLCELGTSNGDVGAETCSACNPGSFSATLGRLECAECALGTFTASPNSFECSECEPGSFAPTTGLAECTACPVGKYESFARSTVCIDCPVGKYADSTSSKACKACESGFYGPDVGLSTCAQCSKGTYSVGESSACTECETGKFASAEGASSCTNCELGMYSSTTGAETCTKCGPGLYQNDIGQSTCLSCEPGKATSVDGSITCPACNSGTFAAGLQNTICHACSSGKYSVRLSTSLTGPVVCNVCDVGTSQPSSGQARCLACPVGQFSNVTEATTCNLCVIGKYNNRAQQTKCEDCRPGYYASNPASVICQKCGAGRYQPVAASSTCFFCDAGTYQSLSAKSTCESCEQGFYSENGGQAVCDICPPGTFGPLLDQDTQALRNASNCISCGKGTYQDNSGATVCKNCFAGRYSSNDGSPLCSICPSGTYSLDHATICNNCIPGFHQDKSGQSTCNQCGYGEFTSSHGQPFCEKCPVGRFSNTLGSSICNECPGGMSNSETGKLQCTYCTAGRFALPGQAQCTLCSDGTATSTPASSKCTVCGERAIASQDRTECKCRPGFFLPSYKPDSNFWDCLPCPTGANCAGYGTTWETLYALPGYWRPTNASMTFMRCAIPAQCTGGPAVSSIFADDGSSGSGCSENRYGIACTSCKEGYRPSGNECTVCPDGDIQWVMIVVLAALVVIIVLISVYVILKSGDDILLTEVDQTHGVREPNNTNVPMASAPVPPQHHHGETEMANLGGNQNGVEWSADDFEEETENDDDDDLNMEEVQAKHEQDVLAISNAIGPKSPESNFTYKFKIFISFMQISYSLVSDLNFRWPETYQDVMSYVGITSLDFLLENITGADCFSQENYYFMYMGIMIAPIVAVFLLGILWVLPREMNMCCWRNYSVEAKDRNTIHSWRLVLYFLFLVFPSCSSTVLRHYICDDVDGNSFLVEDYRVKCYTELWNIVAYISASFILIYPVGIPVFFFVMLRQHRLSLQDIRTKARFGFLYGGYKQDRWWWEMVDSAHKLFLVAIIAFFPTKAQLAIGMCVAILYLMALLVLNPYAHPSDDIMHQVVQIEIFLLILAGYLFEEFSGKELTDLEDYGLSIILLMLTLGIIIMFIVFAVIAARSSCRAYKENKRIKALRDAQMAANQEMTEEEVQDAMNEKSEVESAEDTDKPEHTEDSEADKSNTEDVESEASYDD